MSETVKLYNPANAAALTPEELAGLQTLTVEQLKELAIAYPNSSKAYLLIMDKNKPFERQLPSLSTFQNLYNLITRNAQTQYVAYSFRDNYKPQPIKSVRPRKSEVLDMTDIELMELPGLPKILVGKQSGFKPKDENPFPFDIDVGNRPSENTIMTQPAKKMGRPPKIK